MDTSSCVRVIIITYQQQQKILYFLTLSRIDSSMTWCVWPEWVLSGT